MTRRSNAKAAPRAPASKTSWTQESLEDEFHRELGRLVHETARFDFLVGLQLNWLGPYCGVDVSKLLDPRSASLDNRLQQLKKLIRTTFVTAGPDVLKEFDRWFASAHAARALRNNYVHGRWGVPGRLEESPLGAGYPRIPVLAFVALDWDMTPGQADRSVYMTLVELREQVAEAVLVFRSFFGLVEKHLAHCLPAQHAAKRQGWN